MDLRGHFTCEGSVSSIILQFLHDVNVFEHVGPTV